MPRENNTLNVFLNGAHVGTLVRKANGAIAFTYSQSWLDSKDALPFSRNLLLREQPYTGKPVQAYFENLIPDDESVRQTLAGRVQAASSSWFDLLAAAGRDCVGALQIQPSPEPPPLPSPPKGIPVSHKQIGELIRSLRTHPLGISSEQDFRISLAGAQSKTALTRLGNRWYLPQGSTPTTHIFKPAIGASADGPDLSLSIENEWLCLKLLQAFGMKTADAEIQEFDGTSVLIVERFDRKWISSKKLLRVPQEDLCQALGVPPGIKYESDGGPGILRVLSFLDESDERDADRRAFLKAQILFWLLAAIDGHAKNFSIFLTSAGFRLTPLYDVMSADPHIHPARLPKQKIKLAMAVGDSRHYKVAEIRRRHWEQTAKKARFPDIDSLMDEIVRQIEPALETVATRLPKSFPAKVVDSIFFGIKERAKRLAS